MRFLTSCFLVVILLAAGAFCLPAVEKLPSGYQSKKIEGFCILIHNDVSAHPREAKQAFNELQAQLRKIKRVLPAKAFAKLRGVKIWIEWEKKKRGAAEYHPSAGWLKTNGYPPQKARCVEINNIRNFVKWSRRTQPWMVLHELAHAYDFQVLGGKHGAVENAYRQAKERGLYKSVRFVTGGKRKAYALTNSREYFAELSEAFFGKNDFFPFNREELRKYDPVGFRLMVEAWEGK